MQAEVPRMLQDRRESGATLQQLHATADSLQRKLQDAMQQATCCGATCFRASQALPGLASTSTLKRLQHHIMSSQTAPQKGMHVCCALGMCWVSCQDVLKLRAE